MKRTARRIIQDSVASGATVGAVMVRLRRTLDLDRAGADRLVREIALDVIKRQPLDFLGQHSRLYLDRLRLKWSPLRAGLELAPDLGARLPGIKLAGSISNGIPGERQGLVPGSAKPLPTMAPGANDANSRPFRSGRGVEELA